MIPITTTESELASPSEANPIRAQLDSQIQDAMERMRRDLELSFQQNLQKSIATEIQHSFHHLQVSNSTTPVSLGNLSYQRFSHSSSSIPFSPVSLPFPPSPPFQSVPTTLLTQMPTHHINTNFDSPSLSDLPPSTNFSTQPQFLYHQHKYPNTLYYSEPATEPNPYCSYNPCYPKPPDSYYSPMIHHEHTYPSYYSEHSIETQTLPYNVHRAPSPPSFQPPPIIAFDPMQADCSQNWEARYVFDEMAEKAVETMWYQTPPPTEEEIGLPSIHFEEDNEIEILWFEPPSPTTAMSKLISSGMSSKILKEALLKQKEVQDEVVEEQHPNSSLFAAATAEEELLKDGEEDVDEFDGSLSMEDFGLDDVHQKDSDGEPTLEGILVKGKSASKSSAEKDDEDDTGAAYAEIKKDLNSLSREEQMDVVYSPVPELVGLLLELNDAFEQLENKINPLLSKVKEENNMVKGGMHHLEVKHALLLAYCQAINFYLLLKSEGQPVRDHPVIARLVEIKSLLDKIKQLYEHLVFYFEEILNKQNGDKPEVKLVNKNVTLAYDFSTKIQRHSLVSAEIQGTTVAKDTTELVKLDSSKDHGIGEKRKCQNDQIGIQSMEMLKVRASLEEKLKQKGIFSSHSLKPDKTEKLRLQRVNGQLETVADLDDETINMEGGRISKILSGVGGLLVQIGTHLYGKVHFTELTTSWVSDPLPGYHEGQFVKCKVLEISRLTKGTVQVDLSLCTILDGLNYQKSSGLSNNGDIQSRPDQVQMLLKGASEHGAKRIRLHILTDGCDVLDGSSVGYVETLEKDLEVLRAKFVDAQITSGGGRAYVTMDRYENDWSVVKRGWDAQVLGDAPYRFRSALEAVKKTQGR